MNWIFLFKIILASIIIYTLIYFNLAWIGLILISIIAWDLNDGLKSMSEIYKEQEEKIKRLEEILENKK